MFAFFRGFQDQLTAELVGAELKLLFHILFQRFDRAPVIVVELFDLIVGAVEFVRFVLEDAFQGFHLRLILPSRLQLDQRQFALVLALLVGGAAFLFGSGRLVTGSRARPAAGK